MKKFIKKVPFYCAGVLAIIMCIALGSAALSTSTVTYAEGTHEVIDLTPQKIDALKKEVVAAIEQCESQGNGGLIIFDTNHKASIGVMQFQVSTVQHYAKALYDQKLTAQEAMLLALDNDKAVALAEDIVFKQDGLKNWLNCANKLGLRAQVDAITFLEK